MQQKKGGESLIYVYWTHCIPIKTFFVKEKLFIERSHILIYYVLQQSFKTQDPHERCLAKLLKEYFSVRWQLGDDVC